MWVSFCENSPVIAFGGHSNSETWSWYFPSCVLLIYFIYFVMIPRLKQIIYGFVLWWWKDTIPIYGYLRGTRHWVVTRLMDDPGAIVIGHSVATSDDINIVSTVNNHQRQDQTQDRGLISWYLCCVLINSLGIYSTSLWLLNLVLNWCKKFIKQPTVCSLHNLKSDCHKMTNTAVTEHYPRLGLFAALIYWAVSCEGGWGVTPRFPKHGAT